MRRAILIVAASMGALLAARQAVGSVANDGGAGELAAGLIEDTLGVVEDAAYSITGYRVMSDSRWLQAAARDEFAGSVQLAREAEARYGIPPNLWVRTLWQESRFKPDAYNAGSGASGIAQIVPRWHPGVDPWNVAEAIDYGAGYLASLYKQFGTWELALKAYNWGPGNVQKWLKGGADAPIQPLETVNYSLQILADLAAVGEGVA